MRIKFFLFLTGLLFITLAACSPGEPVTVTPVATDTPVTLPTETPVPDQPTGVFAGSVKIGPLCPVEPCTSPVGDIYSSRPLQLRSELASGTSDSISVFLNQDGTFRTPLPVGQYEVGLSNCKFLGCSGSLPVTIEIVQGETFGLNINIDTGIRSAVRPPMSLARLEEGLRNAGAVVAAGGDISQPFFAVTGQILAVNGTDIQVFEYPSIEDGQAEAAKIGPDGSTIGTTSVMWVAPPHFYASGTLIVLYVGDDQSLLTLLENALGKQIAGREPIVSETPSMPDVSSEADSTARRELSARLGVEPGDLRLVYSRILEFSDGSLGCPDAGFSYTQAIIPGYILLYELEGTRYPFHVSIDGQLFTDCRGENNVAAPFRLADDIVKVRDAFELDGGGPAHLGPEVFFQTRAEAEAYLAGSNGLVEMDLGKVDWETEMLVGTVITGSGCSFKVVTPLALMQHLDKTVTVYVEAEQTGLCEKAWAQPVWLALEDIPKDYSAGFILSYAVN